MRKENYFQSCGCKWIIATGGLFLDSSVLYTRNSYPQQAFIFTSFGDGVSIDSTQIQTKNSYSVGSFNGSLTISEQNKKQIPVPATGIWITQTRSTRHYNPSGGGSPGSHPTAIALGSEILKIVKQ
jgi:hypothetical protein